MSAPSLDAFINYQLFLAELCDVLGVPRPQPAVPDVSQNAYVFERCGCCRKWRNRVRRKWRWNG